MAELNDRGGAVRGTTKHRSAPRFSLADGWAVGVVAAFALSFGIAACAPSTSPAACSDPSACYRMGSDGRLHPAYRPQPVEAHVIPIDST